MVQGSFLVPLHVGGQAEVNREGKQGGDFSSPLPPGISDGSGRFCCKLSSIPASLEILKLNHILVRRHAIWVS